MFTWDEDKSAANIEKHGVGFATASRIFEGFVLTAVDDRFDYGEVRKNSIGLIDGFLFLTVTHTDRDGATRIISARPPSAAKGGAMSKRYGKKLSVEELAALPDDEIDTSDIPELGDDFWRKAELVEPEGTEQVTLRVKKSVLQAYRATGKGYQTRMNAVLESYARSLRK